IASILRRRASSRATWIDVSGVSMGKTILAGSRVRIAAAGAPPRWGEIWAFCNETGALVVHRCRARRGAGWLFQGDASPGPDPLVVPGRLIGRVVAVENEGRIRSVGSATRWIGGIAHLTRRSMKKGVRLARYTAKRVRRAT